MNGFNRDEQPPYGRCPACGSINTRMAERKEWRTPFTFQAVASRKCQDCGQIWEPAVVRWVLVLGAVLGLGFFGGGVVLLAGGEFAAGATGLLVGAATVAGCMQRWRRKPAVKVEA